jgi:hypothetical protein
LAAAKRRQRTQGSDAGRSEWPAGEGRSEIGIRADTPPGVLGGPKIHAKNESQRPKEKQSERTELAVSTRDVRRDATFRQKVIGRRFCPVAGGVDAGSVGVFAEEDRTIWMVYEQAGQRGSGIFSEPLIEQGGDLLAEIGGVTKTRKFVALERVARSSEQEFPGWLGIFRGRSGHGPLQMYLLSRNDAYSNCSEQRITSSFRVTGLWISVDAVENAMRACSGCGGDYEDPDRMMWEEETEEEEEEREQEQ